MSSKYAKTGVDVHKKGIEVFEATVKNIIPGAFCVVTPDPDLPEYGLITHLDGAGSKTITNWLMAKEYDDNTYFRSVATDIVAMNIDDTDCVNSEPRSFADYVAINGFTTPKQEFLKALNQGLKESFDLLDKFGINPYFAGGETADLPD